MTQNRRRLRAIPTAQLTPAAALEQQTGLGGVAIFQLPVAMVRSYSGDGGMIATVTRSEGDV
ncbi:MAG: hypothetical protein Tsb0027_20380 [Wenzhouxiangellaceae bacterium]